MSLFIESDEIRKAINDILKKKAPKLCPIRPIGENGEPNLKVEFKGLWTTLECGGHNNSDICKGCGFFTNKTPDLK